MPNWLFTNVTPTSGQVVTTGEAKRYMSLPVGKSEHDLIIDKLLSAAITYFQEQTRVQLLTSVDDLTFDRFPPDSECIWIPRWPLVSITSIKYQDEDDAEQTWTSTEYIVSLRKPARVSFAHGFTTYPTTTTQRKDTVVIRLTTGYGTAANVPEDIKVCLSQLAYGWFWHSMGETKSFNQPSMFNAKKIIEAYKIGDAYWDYTQPDKAYVRNWETV